MPTAICVSVAEKVKAMLDAATLSKTFTPERSYADWDLELTEEGQLHVDVCAVTTKQEAELESRGSIRFNVPVDIAVRYKFLQSQQESTSERVKVTEVDPYILLVEEVHGLFMPHRLTNFQSGVWQSTEILVNPNRLFLKSHRQFYGLVRVTFRASKAVS